MPIDNEKGILLESGTNEFEIIEFSVNNVSYGINVAKVREVINRVPTTALPNVHPYVEGIFTLRGRIMPLVNMHRCLGLGDDSAEKANNIIVSEMNNYFVGFLVNKVSRIHRISWTQMEPPPSITDSEKVVGVIKMENTMIVLLDFEKIVAEINPEINRKLTTIPATTTERKSARNKKTLLVAEDSHMLRDLLTGTLKTAGYEKILAFTNGQEAWDALEKMCKTPSTIEEHVQLIVSDIEMPQMDGHHLLKRIREHRDMSHLPVVLFSSLINDEMRRKGEALGANAQISKPEIAQLIDIVDREIL